MMTIIDNGLVSRMKAITWSVAGLFVLREFRVLKIAMRFHGDPDLLHAQYGMLFRVFCLVLSWAVIWAITDINNAEKYNNLLVQQRKNRRLRRPREHKETTGSPYSPSNQPLGPDNYRGDCSLSSYVDSNNGQRSSASDRLALELLRQRIHKLHADIGSLPNLVPHSSPCMSCCSTMPSEGDDLSPRPVAMGRTPSPAATKSFAAERLNLYLSNLDSADEPIEPNLESSNIRDRWQEGILLNCKERGSPALLREPLDLQSSFRVPEPDLEDLKPSLDNFVTFKTVVLSPWSLHVVTQASFLTLICFMLSTYKVYGLASLPIAVIGCIGFINITEFLRILKWERAKRWIVAGIIVFVSGILWGKPVPKDQPCTIFMASGGNVTAIILIAFCSIITGFVLVMMGLAGALGARGTFPLIAIRIWLRKRGAVLSENLHHQLLQYPKVLLGPQPH